MKVSILFLVFAVGVCTGQVIQLYRSAVVEIQGANPESSIRGRFLLEQPTPTSPVKMTGEVYGLPAGPHGIHIHESGDISNQCLNVGEHFNPLGKRHGGPTDPERHAGDLGNIRSMPANPNRASFKLNNDGISLDPASPVYVGNLAVVIHSNPDDLGRGASSESLITGNAGAHLACGVIIPKDSFGLGSRNPQIRETGETWTHEAAQWGRESDPYGKSPEWYTRRPFEKTGTEFGKVPSNLDLEGVEQPDYTQDVLTIKSAPMSTSRIWKAGNVYEYEYTGWIATGMPAISPQLGGGLIKGRLIVEPKDETTILLALTNTRSKLFNEAVMEKWDEANPGQEVRVVDKEHIETPIVVNLVNGKVESVGISREEPLWTVNFKRALAAQLQLQLDRTSAIFSDIETKDFYKTNAVYGIMEGCTTGECQTYYHFSPVPEEEVETNPEVLPVPELCAGRNVYEIVKNRDFNKCKILPVYNYFNTRGLECNLAEFGSCKNAYSRVDIARVIGCVAKDGSFLVQNIKVTDKLIHKPFGYETEAIEGASVQKFKLLNVRSSGSAALSGRVPSDVHVYKSLVYSYDEDLKVEGPLLKKPTLGQHQVPIIQKPRKVAIINEFARLFSEVVETLESDDYYVDTVGKFAVDKINMMKATMMYMDYEELAEMAAKCLGPKQSTASQVFVDTLVYCGTNAAVTLLQELITKGHLTTERAIQAIASLPATVKTPTEELLSSLVQFFRSNVVSEHRRLKITTALALSRLVDKACVNTTDGFKLFPEMVMDQFCTPNSNIVVGELIPLLTEELNNADDDAEKIAILAALGNIGHEAIIPVVLPHIVSCEPSTEEEFNWSQRQTRAIKDESELGKKLLKKKWLKYKLGKSKFEKELEKMKDKEREEDVFGGYKSSKALKHNAKELKQQHKLEAEERKEEMQMKAWELAEKRKQDMDKILEKKFKNKAKAIKKGKNPEWDEEAEVEDEEFLSDQSWLSSAANPEAEEDLEMDVEDQASCNLVRMKAVYALSKLASEKNEAVISILMPITFNKDEESEIRLAALSLLFVHNLPAGFWSRIAISTWFEPNNQISTFVYTTLTSLAQSKDPKKRDMAMKAEAVMPLVKPIRWAPHISTGSINGQFQERTRIGYLANTFTFGGYESFLPSNLYSSLVVRMGPWATKLAEVSLNGKHLEKFIDQWIGEPTRRWKASGVYGGARGAGVAHNELSKIHRELNIEARGKGKPELFIFLNLFDNYQRFYHVDELTFEDMITNLISHEALRGPSGQMSTNYHKFYPVFDKQLRIPSAMGLAYGLKAHHTSMSNIKTKLSGSMALGASTNLEGILQPVAILKFHSKMIVEVPFARAIPTSGVDVTVRAALPGKFAVRGDYVNGKVEATWKFLGDKIRVGHYNVIPYVTIRDVDDFSPYMMLKETKPIALLDTLKQSSTPYGTRATGLKFVYVERHDAKALHTSMAFSKDLMGTIGFLPAPATLRFCEHSVFLDLSGSETKAVRVQLSIAAKHQDQMKSMQQARNINQEGIFSGIYGEKLRSGKFMEKASWDQWSHAKFSRLFESTKKAHGFTIDASAEFISSGIPSGSEWPSGQVKARRFGTSANFAFDTMEQRHKTRVMFERQYEEDPESNFVMCVDGDLNWPRVFAFKRENLLKDEVTTAGVLDIGFGKSCTSDRRISIKAEFKQTDKEEYNKMAHAGLNELKCLKDELKGHGFTEECVNTRRIASIVNKNTITIKYNEMPAALRNMTHKLENVLRHWLGAYLSDNQVGVSNERGQIRIETLYHPVMGTLDIRTHKPESNTFFHNIEVTPIAEAMVPFHPVTTAYRAAFGGPGICVLDEDSATTYDGATYDVELSSCDTVITKDCSGRYKMAVLAREEGNTKIVTVLLNNEKIELNPQLRRVRINGEERSLQATEGVHQITDDLNQIIATVRETRDNMLEVSSPTHWIRVTVDSKLIAVMGSAVHRGRMCGLCGNQNGDKTDDLAGPRKCSLPANLMDAAYELNTPSGCKKSARVSQEAGLLRNVQETCKKKEFIPMAGKRGGYKSFLGRPMNWEWQQGSNRMVSASGCHEIRTKEIVRGGSKCFSVSPMTKCASGCKPVSTIPKKVGFHCTSKSPLTEYLNKEMVRRPLDELMNKEIHEVETIQVPSACIPAY